MTAAVALRDRGGRSWTRVLARWETLLVVALLGLIVLGNALSPFFLTPGNFANLIAALMEVAIMALPMTLIIIAGEIDLSVESMAGLASAILGFLWAAGVPIEVAIPVVLVVGALGGLLNGLLVARGGLPSLVVTLGTLALFRGLALIVLGPRGVSDFPPGFTELGFGHVPGHATSRGRSSSSWRSRSSSASSSTGRGSAARSTPSARTPARRASPASASRASRSACSCCPASSPRSPASSSPRASRAPAPTPARA